MSDSKLWKWGTFFSADKERLKLFGACCFGSWGWEREERGTEEGAVSVTHTHIKTNPSCQRTQLYTNLLKNATHLWLQMLNQKFVGFRLTRLRQSLISHFVLRIAHSFRCYKHKSSRKQSFNWIVKKGWVHFH